MNLNFETAPFRLNSGTGVSVDTHNRNHNHNHNRGGRINISHNKHNQQTHTAAAVSQNSLPVPFVSPPANMNTMNMNTMNMNTMNMNNNMNTSSYSINLHPVPPISSPTMASNNSNNPYKHAYPNTDNTTDSNDTATVMTSNANTIDGHGHATSPQNEHEMPYVSVEGRRKRRRTTFEDAFHHCLSISSSGNGNVSGIGNSSGNDNGNGNVSGMNDNSLLMGDDEIMIPIKDTPSSSSGMVPR